MSRPEILLACQIYPPALAALEREFTVHKLWQASDPDAFISESGGAVRGVVTSGLVGFPNRQIETLPRLELIACFSNRPGGVDLSLTRSRGIVVTVARAPIAVPVAEAAMGLLIDVMRRIAEADRFVRAGKWPAGPFAVGRGLNGKTCGIVGLGAIGIAIAERAAAFGMSIRYHGPREKPGVPYRYDADLEAMAAACDCLFVAAAATHETENLIDARILKALGPQGYLVNVARGSVVDQSALIAALTDGGIAGAGLDVFWDEPRVPAALIAMDNVVLVPHIGATILEVREERVRILLATLRAHFSGEPVPAAV